MSRFNASYWINQLHLKEHIEGGWYKEVYRSDLILDKDHIPSSFNGNRNICTHIYFLLEQKGFSAFHRIKSDELWHFYTGDPLIVYEIDVSGQLTEHLLGNDPAANQKLSCVIQKGNWFGSKVAADGEYALVGCTVAPGFDFTDFELAGRSNLLLLYPQHSRLINELTSA